MSANGRVWEIDFLRGIAIVLMVIFHLVVDLKDFFNYNLEYLSGFWYYEGRLSAVLFMFLSGTSTALSGNQLKNGLVALAWGMILTVGTYFFNPDTYIRFGILHLIGSSLLLYPFIKRLKSLLLLFLAVAIIALGNILSGIEVTNPYLAPFGLITADYRSMDHYPLFPWLGVFLCGVACGKQFYPDKRSLLRNMPEPNLLTCLGRRSLAVYLIHQPVILALLYITINR